METLKRSTRKRAGRAQGGDLDAVRSELRYGVPTAGLRAEIQARVTDRRRRRPRPPDSVPRSRHASRTERR